MIFASIIFWAIFELFEHIVGILLIYPLMKLFNYYKTSKNSMELGRTGNANCVKDADGFIVCKEKYTDINNLDYEKISETEQYKRPDPQNECFIHGEKVVCRDPPFSPYNKYYPTYAPEEIKDYPEEVKPYFEYPYNMIKQSYNWWG